MLDDTLLKTGMVVRSRDGRELGTLSRITDRELVLREPGVFRRELRFTRADVLEIRNDELILARDPDAIEMLGDGTGSLNLSGRQFEEARMDSAKFQTQADQAGLRAAPADEVHRGALELDPGQFERARMGSPASSRQEMPDETTLSLRASDEGTAQGRERAPVIDWRTDEEVDESEELTFVAEGPLITRRDPDDR